MRYLLLVLFLGLSACGKPQYHDSELTPFVTNFEMAYSKDTSHISVTFSDALEGTQTIGECSGDHTSITIQRTFWEGQSDEAKQSIMNHEMGHCVFNRQHTRARLEDGCAASLMDPGSVLGVNCLEPHADSYYTELEANQGK